MPPVSVTAGKFSTEFTSPLIRMFSRVLLMSSTEAVVSVYWMLTCIPEAAFLMMPALLPTRPPLAVLPWRSPLEEQLSRTPVVPLEPAMPPTRFFPLTVPVKLHLRIMPLFVPAMPPAFSWVPVTLMVPETERFLTTPPSWICRKRPASETFPVMRSPVILYPWPSKVPPKAANWRSPSSRAMSLSRT